MQQEMSCCLACAGPCLGWVSGWMGSLLQQGMGSCLPCGVPWQVKGCSHGSVLRLLESAQRYDSARGLGCEFAAQR